MLCFSKHHFKMQWINAQNEILKSIVYKKYIYIEKVFEINFSIKSESSSTGQIIYKFY